MKGVFHNIISGYLYIYSTTLPIIGNDDFWYSQMVKHAVNSNVSKITNILDKFKTNQDLKALITEYIKEALYGTTRAMESLKGRLDPEIDELTKEIDIMKEELVAPCGATEWREKTHSRRGG